MPSSVIASHEPPNKPVHGVEIAFYHTKAISNRKSIFMSREIGLRMAEPLSNDP